MKLYYKARNVIAVFFFIIIVMGKERQTTVSGEEKIDLGT